MTSEKNEIQPETIELRDEIVALDAELAEDFKAQFSVAPFLSRKIVNFQLSDFLSVCNPVSLFNTKNLI